MPPSPSIAAYLMRNDDPWHNESYTLWTCTRAGSIWRRPPSAGEMLMAAHTVSGSRLGTMGAAVRTPISGDYAELAKRWRHFRVLDRP